MSLVGLGPPGYYSHQNPWKLYPHLSLEPEKQKNTL
jgi:hypothetical protein